MGASAFTTCPWKSESCTFAPWGLGSPALCQQLPSTWGGAVPCCHTLAAHSRAGTQNPLPSEHSAPGSSARSGAERLTRKTPRAPGPGPPVSAGVRALSSA